MRFIRLSTVKGAATSTATLLLALSLILPSTLAHAEGTAAVAMPEKHAAQATQRILRSGGNAVDAAITAAFVLAVTLPEAGNIGGGGFMVSHVNGEDAFLDFRERAPGKAHRDMYLDEGGNFVQAQSLIGGRASGIPGTVRGMLSAHQRYGTLPWATLLQPAIDLARDGFIVGPSLAEYAAEKVIEVAGETNFATYFSAMRDGENFKQDELAATLARIAKQPEEFYTGQTARQITAQMARSGGLISRQDLADYKAVWRTPLREQWRDYTIVTAAPPSSGGIALIQLLKMHDYAGVYFQDVRHNSAQYIHLLAEIEKRAFADRAAYLGDPDFVSVPTEKLLDERYLKQRAGEINPLAMSATSTVAAGLESSDTAHFSIVDKHGNAVAITYTLNWEFGSGVVVEGAGFVLNNQMDDFSAKVGVKNKFGVIGNTLNAIAPHKRMLSSMTPTILLKKGEPALIIGTSGGSTIFTSVMQVILNLYDYAMPLQTAVDATRFHHQLPDALLIRHDQREISEQTQSKLRKIGYAVEANSWGNLGNIQAIKIDQGKIEAASDIRGRGEARLIN
ncbi:MAG: gamma-glutamyltranspeptidase/glutathione hydrolase [Halioglobus sp.]